MTCIGMWRGSIWTWRNCDGAQCHGAPYGRARPRTVWITFRGRMMFRGKLNCPASNIFLPPWTVRRQVWKDSLKPQHSGISTDILLFSNIHLSLVHHYLSCQVSPPGSVSEPTPSQICRLAWPRWASTCRGVLRCRWGSPRIPLSCRPPRLLIG